MDRPLDEVISDRQRGNYRGRSRRSDWPRDGVRKNSPMERSRDIDRDWVHDRFEDEPDSRRPRRRHPEPRAERYEAEDDRVESGTRLRVDGLHYDLTEDDLRELFERIGPVTSLQLLYDRQDRSKGTAFVTYSHHADARAAIDEFDGANAHGQPIHLSIAQQRRPPPARNPFDDVQVPSRSLFDRIETPVGDEREPRRGARGGRRARSASPGGDRPSRYSDVSKPAPSGIDRYVPGESSGRSDSRRRDAPRGRRGDGRRPGERRGGGRARTDEEGRPMVGGRPKKTAEELDAEMADYFGGGGAAEEAPNGPGGQTNGAHQNPHEGTTAPAGDDIDMIL